MGPEEEVRLIVPWDPARLSPNLRLQPSERRRRERASAVAASFARRWAGDPRLEGPVVVRYVVRRARAMDDDNAEAALKHVRDALFNRKRNGEGITLDDSPARLSSLGVTFEIAPRYKRREEVLVIATGFRKRASSWPT